MIDSLVLNVFLDLMMFWSVVCGLDSFVIAFAPLILLWLFFIIRINVNRNRIKLLLSDLEHLNKYGANKVLGVEDVNTEQ